MNSVGHDASRFRKAYCPATFSIKNDADCELASEQNVPSSSYSKPCLKVLLGKC